MREVGFGEVALLPFEERGGGPREDVTWPARDDWALPLGRAAREEIAMSDITFFKDPADDRLFGIVMELAQEVYLVPLTYQTKSPDRAS